MNKFPFEVGYTFTKVVGIGDAGIRVIRYLQAQRSIKTISYATINSDNQTNIDLLISGSGRGFGGDVELGRRSAEASVDDVERLLAGANRIFIVCGMGGGTGTGASPVVARVAREIGGSVRGVVSTPFTFEGSRRSRAAHEGAHVLTECVDSLTVINNDRLLNLIEWVDSRTSLDEAFALATQMMAWNVLAQLA